MASPYWFYGAGSSDPGVLSDCGRPYPSCRHLWSDAMYFSSPGRKIPGVPVSKQAPSIGRGLFLRFWGICISSYRNLTYP